MVVEVILTSELCAAVFAVERLSVDVRRHVPRQRRPGQELSLAQVALMLASERVSPCVHTLLLLRRESFAAQRAEMGLSEVYLDVHFHRLAASKSAAAVFAAVRFLAGMDTNVLHQLEGTAQHLSANLADKRRTAAGRPIMPLLQYPVLTHVLRQLETLGKCLRANGAAERQGEQRFVVSLNRRLGCNISIQVIHEF